MSITSALSNALSGLTAASRGAQVVSSNVANSLTDGYGVRELSLTARFGGGIGGVAIASEVRNVDLGLISERRLADASFGLATTTADFSASMEAMIGLPGEAGSLSTRVANLENSFLEATAFPSSEPLQRQILSNATALTDRLNDLSDAVQIKRVEADQNIADQISLLNTALQQVVSLNSDIERENLAGTAVSGLMDQRQQVIDSIAELVPLREIPRENGRVALITTGGLQLVEGPAAVFGFSPTATIAPEMSIDSGSLSGLTLNGRALSQNNRGMEGGSIAANFQIRDDLAPKTQSQLDSFARDFLDRFQNPTVDPTLAIGDAGLMTDGGAFFDPLNEVGLAGRISVNSAVDPDQGGNLSRLRDGIGAVTLGAAGNGTQLQSYFDAMRTRQPATSGAISVLALSTQELASEFLSTVSQQKYALDNEAAFAQSKSESLKGLEQAGGVDTDAEMQKLLLIEQAYGANARVIQTIDDLIQTLIRI